jgi:hypothetical protein
MIRTEEELQELARTVSRDDDSLWYIPPSSVPDLEETRKLGFELYTDEDTRRANIDTNSSIVLGANAVLAAILTSVFQAKIPGYLFILLIFCLLSSVSFAINAIRPRDSKRPLLMGDTANSLNMSPEEHKGAVAYTYFYNFFKNREINDEKKKSYKISLNIFAATILVSIAMLIPVSLGCSWIQFL